MSSNPEQLLDEILRQCVTLNDRIRNGRDQISVNQANRLESNLRQAEGWLKGCRELLE
jgi:hypothetical protein